MTHVMFVVILTEIHMQEAVPSFRFNVFFLLMQVNSTYNFKILILYK